MKRKMALVIAVAVVFSAVNLAVLNLAAADEAAWINVTVTDLKTKKDIVQVKLPLEFVTNLLESGISEAGVKMKSGCKLDFSQLRKAGKTTLFYVESLEEQKIVRIWID